MSHHVRVIAETRYYGFCNC